MGASEFIVKQRGKSLREAYQQAKDDAEDEYGHQEGYSGQINCTDGVTDATAKYKSSGMSLPKYIDHVLEKCNKRDCYAICLSEPVKNTNTIKSKVEHIVTPGTKKWVLKYAVWSFDDKLISFDDKGSAVKWARDHVERRGHGSVSVEIEKVLEKGSPTVAMITYKQSSKEKPGEWVFFGLAPD